MASVCHDGKARALARFDSETRIFVGPREIAGFYTSLHRGLLEIGEKSDLCIFFEHPYSYEGEAVTNSFVKLLRKVNPRQTERVGLRVIRAILGELLAIVFVPYAAFRYQVFIFGFGQSILRFRNLDLYLWRALRKKVIMNISHGSDARAPYFEHCEQRPSETNRRYARRLERLTRKRFQQVRRLERLSDVVIGHPLSSSTFASKKFVNSLEIGIPSYVSGEELESGRDSVPTMSPVRLLHAPSNKCAKGTEQILSTVRELQRDGLNVEIEVLDGADNSTVVRAIQNTDLVVDQLYSDGPLPGLASEAAIRGKPALVSGYGLRLLHDLSGPAGLPPSINCLPHEYKSKLVELVASPESLREFGAEVQRYVETNWLPRRVAARFMLLAGGDLPDAWLCDPTQINYVAGAGIQIDKLLRQVALITEHCGSSALFLDSRPDLLQSLVRLRNERAGRAEPGESD